MNSKMTTNSQLSKNEPKRKTMKTKTKQTTRIIEFRHHTEEFQWGGGNGGKGTGNRKHK